MSEQEKNNDEVKSIELRKVYIDDASIEVPKAPQIYQEISNGLVPEISFQLSHKINKLDDEFYAINLRVTVKAENEESNETIYIVEVSQGGVFQIKGLNDLEMHHALNSYCLSLLFPYASEAAHSLIARAGFLPIFLQPVNFDALYKEHIDELLKAQEDNAEEK